MDIFQSNDKWYFVVKIPNQTKSTPFEIMNLKDNEFFCINEENDFPKKIRYWIEKEKLKVVISNETMEIPFEFKKIR